MKNKNKKMYLSLAIGLAAFMIFSFFVMQSTSKDNQHKILGHGAYISNENNDHWEFSFNTYVLPKRFTIFQYGKLVDFGTWEFISDEKDSVILYGQQDKLNFGYLSYDDNWNFLVQKENDEYSQIITTIQDGSFREISEYDLDLYYQSRNENELDN